MTRKKSIVKAYKRKWHRMPESDRIFVMKFLGAALSLILLVILLLFFLISHIPHHADSPEASNISIEATDSGGSPEASPEATDSENISEKNAPIQSEENLFEHSDVQLLAKLITAETGSSSDQAQIAIASVVMNRVNSAKFPDTVFEVIYQKGQYSPTWNGSIDNEPDEQALKNALYVYQNGSQIPSNVLYQSRYIQGSGIWAQIDGNYFCYE